MKTYENFISPTLTRYKAGKVSTKVGGAYVANNPYHFAERRSSRFVAPDQAWWMSPLLYHGSPHLSPVYPSTNRLYAKLREELLGKDLSETLTTVVEWRTSLDMITSRAGQMYKAYSALRRFQFSKAARILTMRTPSAYKDMSAARARTLKLSPTGLWLEYWMGWAPLVGDIANAIKQIEKSPFEQKSFSVGVTLKDKFRNVFAVYDDGMIYTKNSLDKEVASALSAYGKVMITNHNYYLATRMGLLNPAQTAWQVLPFSFLVDWFVNVGQVIGSLTDFCGLAFSDTGMASKADVFVTAVQTEGRKNNPPHNWHNQAVEYGRFTERRRTPGPLPTPRLEVVMLDKLSLTRAATSVSLLTEIFLRK